MNWFGNTSFRNKFFVAFGVPLFFITQLTVLGTVTIKNIESSFERLADGPNKRLVYASDAVAELSNCRRCILSISYMTDDADYVKMCYDSYQASAGLIISYLDAYYYSFMNDVDLGVSDKESRKIIIDEVKDKFVDVYRQYADELYKASLDEDKEKINEILAECIPVGEEILSELQTLRLIVQEHADEITAETLAYADRSTILLIVFAAFTSVISLMAAIVMSSLIRKPIYKMKAGMAEIAKGNLQYPIRSNNKDELGMLSNQIGDMVDTISVLNKAIAIVDNVDELIFVTDLEYNLIFVNRKAEEVFGQNNAASAGQKCHSLIFNGADKPCPFCPLPDLLPEKDSFPSCVWEQRLDINGRDIWFSCRTSIMRWVDGSLVQIFTYKDDTLRKSHDEELKRHAAELREAAEAAKEASQAKTIFLAKMSHEIRTPINSVMGMSELILRADAPGGVHENALAIKRASQSLLAIVNDILELSKIESGKLEIVETGYAFRSLINDVISIVRIKLAEKPVTFVVNIDPGIPSSLVGDEAKIRHALLNLLENAVKYTMQGFVSLDVSGKVDKAGGEVVLTMAVTDSGPGIKEEYIGDLFGEFVQIDTGESTNTNGTGLGLPVALKLCKAMGGNITAKSEYGTGSTFTITLPQKFDEYTPFASVDNPEEKLVLLCEANPQYRKSVERAFADLGVKYAAVEGITELLDIPKKYTHLFIDYAAYSSMFDSGAPPLQSLSNPPKLIIVGDTAEPAAQKEAHFVSYPVYSLPISNILNDIYEERDGMFLKSESFTAPDAKILIVDDMPSNLMVAKGLMSPYEMNITTCTSGEEAVRLVAGHEYDLIFMDHMMPKMDGLETARRIREMEGEYFAHVPIIALSANAISGAKEMFIQNSMSDFLAKPIQTDKLDVILGKWISSEKRRVKSARKPQENQQKEDSEFLKMLREVQGLSAGKAISAMGGAADTYEGIVKLSVRLLPENIGKLNEFLNASPNDYAIEVHGVKGVLNNIGAYKIGEVAQKLEDLSKNGDMEACRQIHPGFISALTEFMDSVTAIIDKTESSEKLEGDISELISIMPGLEEAVEFFGAANALKLLESIRGYSFGDDIDGMVEDVTRAFEDFDFDAAEDYLTIMRRALKIDG